MERKIIDRSGFSSLLKSLVFVLLFVLSGCKDSFVIKGRLVDEATEKPISGIEVDLTYNGDHDMEVNPTMTNKDGFFRISVGYSKVNQLYIKGAPIYLEKFIDLKVPDESEYDFGNILMSRPSFHYEGRDYYVAPASEDNMNWGNAMLYCENLLINGLGGWRMPDIDELKIMYFSRKSFGYYYRRYIDDRDDTYCRYCYWSNTVSSNGEHYYLKYSGDGGSYPNDAKIKVCPVRVKD